MLSIAIDRAKTQYRMPARTLREQPRVQRIVDDALARVLEGAMERRGIGPDGYVCIRDVHAVAPLRLREPDSALASSVADAIAAAVEALIDDASPSVVQYGSRAHALVDLASSAVGGDFRRSWAWAQVGIWRADFPLRADVTAELILRTLAKEPTHAAAVMSHLARTQPDRFGELVARATPRAWSALAQATIAAAGVGGHVALRWIREPGAPPSADRHRTEPQRSAATSMARRVGTRSAIARIAMTRFAAAADDVRAALAVLALLETEPSAIQREDVAWMLTAIENAIASGPEPRDVTRRDFERNRAAAGTATQEPIGWRRDSPSEAAPAPGADDRLSDGREASPAEAWRPRRAAHDASVPADADPAAPVSQYADRVAHDRTRPQGDESTDAVPDVRQSTRTEHGGVLYLVNLLSRMGLVDTLRGDERWADRGLRWVLHQLSMILAPIEPDDPAALVFAGLPPGAPAPSSEQDPPTDHERAALETLRTTIAQTLRDALGDLSEASAESDLRLMTGVCRRPARIVAEPGWVEAHFSLEDVSLDIRRAGLDRDPGWIPWLGIVLRFVYA